MKLQESKGRLYCTIPTQFVKLLGWTKGMEVSIYPSNEKNTLTIKPMPEGGIK